MPEADRQRQDFVGTRIGSFHTCDFVSEGKDLTVQSTSLAHRIQPSKTLQIVLYPLYHTNVTQS